MRRNHNSIAAVDNTNLYNKQFSANTKPWGGENIYGFIGKLQVFKL